MGAPFLTCLSLCSGAAGLELGVALANPGLRTVGYVERDSYAATVLLARMEDASLEPAPVWCGSLEDAPTGCFAGVDLVTAGFPCQPFSAAGKRAGTQDVRWLWPSIAELLRVVEPKWVFLENVPGLVRHGLPAVLGDLAELGFDAEWSVFSAAESGAPHLRKRLFILAAHPVRIGQRHDAQGVQEGQPEPSRSGDPMADTDRRRLPVERGGSLLDGKRTTSRDDADGCSGTVPNPQGSRLAQRQGLHTTPKLPGLGEGRWWAAEPDVGRVAHGVAARVDRLRVIGNGVVPAVAARAWSVLMERLKGTE